MSLKVRYILFIGVLHLLLMGSAYLLFKEKPLYFIPLEIVLFFSLFIAFRIYKAMVRPLRLIRFGINAIKDADFNITFPETSSKEINQLIRVYNAMINKIREERVSLKEQHFFLEKLIDASPSGIVILDFDNKIANVNPAALSLLQLDESILGTSVIDLNNRILQKASTLKEGKSEVIALDGWRQYKCHRSHFIHQGFERYFILIEELSNELLETEKHAYGKVIRMMAHEVNNSIGAVNSILQSVREIHEMENPDSEVTEALSVAEGRNDRLNIFMRNFADVIRLPEPKIEHIDLNILVTDVAELMALQAKQRNIKFELELCPSPLNINADQAQMEQVLINIIKNSIEAIENQGWISLTTSQSPTRLIIKDNGQGLDQETSENIFKPFFSSKPNGQGIGLTVIKEILHKHQYKFSLKTNPQGYTCFEIIFDNTHK